LNEKKGGLWGAISAGVAFGIGHSGMFQAMYKAVGNMKAVVKALAHGLSRAAISAVRGGKAMGGFLSGFAGSLLGGVVKGLDYAKGNIGTIMKVTMTAIAGGTASVLGGGKFANGAMSSAFVVLFNHYQSDAEATKAEMEKNGRTDLRIAHGKGEKGYYVTDSRGFKYMSDTPELQRSLESLKVGLAIPATIAGGGVMRVGYGYVMANPVRTYQFLDAALTGVPSVSQMSTAAGQYGQAVGWILRQLK